MTAAPGGDPQWTPTRSPGAPPRPAAPGSTHARRNAQPSHSVRTSAPRWCDGRNHLALDTGGGPIARLWATALGGLVDTDT